ncbi:MAG: J domain-containing protein [Kiritimatiellae bacterium]|nr:J domain-containing protein [Kiritimatiellia bacterium]
MNWRGKAIGGSIGSFFGPMGALAGAAAGHFFVDRKNAGAAERHSLRLVALAAGALHELAVADGRFTLKEDAAVRSILGEISRQTGASLTEQDIAYLVDDSPRLHRCVERLAVMAREVQGLAPAAAVWFWRTAVSDGDPTTPEIACINFFARHAGISDEVVRQAALLYARSGVTTNDTERRTACETLGVPYNADPAVVKSAYRRLSLKYHPDKHAGLDPDIRALTAEKFSQLTEAYNLLEGHGPLRMSGLVAKFAETGRLGPACEKSSVKCFVCGRKGRLPEESGIIAARCSNCQALLAFERDLAERLI